MTDEQIIEMAREAKLPHYWETGDIVWFDGVRHFAKLVAAKEREACAKIADEWAVGWPHPSKVIAEEIRARGQE